MFRKLVLFVCLGVCLGLTISTPAHAQSITSGDISGTVTDPSGAAVPGASVTLLNLSTNTTQKTATNVQGVYRFGFLPPGRYTVTVNVSGFQPQQQAGLLVVAGQPTAANVTLQVAAATQTVEVSEASEFLQTENADVTTTFRSAMVDNLPNPGGDITYWAQTAPGVVMNTQAGFGNFSANGMPGTSNLFTINGQNENDPFLSINNSGASNLLLGSNDIAEVNVINNAYSAQYGQFAGTQVTYVTKSGTNDFHGDAIYNWNGRALNSNQFFSNEVGQPTPFNNFNQWQTDVNGPIWKSHTFFDAAYEGVHNVLPTASALTLIPSPQFEKATLANLTADGNAAEIPFYNQVFGVYNDAPGVGSATPVAGGGCQGETFAGLGSAPCALQFRTTPPNEITEYQWSGRVDHVFSDKDRAYIRVLRDNGFQPTFTSPFGKTFNDQSLQPEMSGQIAETHVFDPNTVNEFKGSALFYAAFFGPSDESGALSALPTFLAFSGSPFTSIGYGEPPYPPGFFFPQGRRVFQYQVIDDISHIHGNHTFRSGFSWLHENVTDLDFPSLGGPVNGAVDTTLANFFAGGGAGTNLFQGFPSTDEAGFRYNTIGGYVADDWKVNNRLTLSLNLRMEHYASPTCDTNCFSRLASSFTGAPDANAASTPYNQFIIAGEHDAYPHTTPLVWEPRVGIAWRPFNSDKTVIRTGAGVFADELPGGNAEFAAFNTPGLNAFTIGNGPIAPGVPGSLFTIAAAANKALLTQFSSGGSFNSISATVPGFVAPNFTSFPDPFKQPTYYKWNFGIEQVIPWRMVLNLNYSGMHGSHIPVDDEGLNAYCPTSICTSGFAGLPTAPANAAFGLVQQYFSAGTSNYNGLTVSLQRRLSAGLSFNLNYTWSHALDDVSNGGFPNEPFNAVSTDSNVTTPLNPFNIRGNYANSDYDVRNYLSASFVYTDMFRHSGFHRGPNRVFGGWTLSSNWFWRSGLPFTVTDGEAVAPLLGLNYGGLLTATPLTAIPTTCNNAVNAPCLSTSQFEPAVAVPTGFGTIGRNSVYGPHFFDVDLGLMKDMKITEHVTFSFGAQAYNVLNHVNFDQPVQDVSNPLFGYSTAAVGPPTSLLGSFVGAGSSPRFVEIRGVVRF